jgi:hypothetical protein
LAVRMLSGGRLWHGLAVDLSAIHSPGKLIFFSLGFMSRPIDDVLLTNTLEAGAVEEVILVARCPDRFAAPEVWLPLYVLGVPLRPLILRGPLFAPPYRELFYFFLVAEACIAQLLTMLAPNSYRHCLSTDSDLGVCKYQQIEESFRKCG